MPQITWGEKGDAPGQFERRDLSHRKRQARFRLQFARVDLCLRRGRRQSEQQRRIQKRLHVSPSFENFRDGP